MKKKISVIIPVYNTEKYIEECLNSVLNQTYSNYEIIVVNDGSIDNSRRIIEKLELSNDKIKLYNKKNGGLSSARNYGITKATGDYIFFLDSDDLIQNNTLEYLLKIQEDSENSISICQFEKFINFYNYDNKEVDKIVVYTPTEYFEKILQLKYNFYACGALFPKKYFNKNTFPLNMYFEDLACMFSVFSKAKRIYITNYKLYKYRMNDSSIIHSINPKKSSDYRLAVENMLKFINDNYDFSKDTINTFKCESYIESFIFTWNKSYVKQFKNIFNIKLIRTCSLKYKIKFILFNYSRLFRKILILKNKRKVV